MAYRRSLSTRANLISRRQQPSFSYALHHDEERRDESPSQEKLNSLMQQKSLLRSLSRSGALGTTFQDRGCSSFSLYPSVGSSFCRYMSTTVGEGAENTELMSDVAGAFTDTTVQAAASQAAAVSEVAIAAADSFPPVMVLQYVIDYVHQLSGFNWWASIALTTLLIRGATVPLLVNQLKATAKLAIIKPRMEEIKEEMQAKATDPAAMNACQNKMKQLFKESGVSPFTPLKGLFIQGPVFASFFFAITNMAEKVPSLKTGGIYWFTDLTTPDSFYIFPILAGLTFLITVETNMQEGMEGNPMGGIMKNVMRGLAVLTVPFTMNFPKAIFCYWITSNIFSLGYGLALKQPGVKKFLNIPNMPVSLPSKNQTSPFSALTALKHAMSSAQEPTPQPVSSPPPPYPSPFTKFAERKTSSNSVLSQRLSSLEKEVKGRRKNKKKR